MIRRHSIGFRTLLMLVDGGLAAGPAWPRVVHAIRRRLVQPLAAVPEPARRVRRRLRGRLGRGPLAPRAVPPAGALDGPERGRLARPGNARHGARHPQPPVRVPAAGYQPVLPRDPVPRPVGRGARDPDRPSPRLRPPARARLQPPLRARDRRRAASPGVRGQAGGPPRAGPARSRLPRRRSRWSCRAAGSTSARWTRSNASSTRRWSTRSRSACRSASGTGSTRSPTCARRRARSSGCPWTCWTARSRPAGWRSSTARPSTR